ncbi:MAG: glycosyltransferase family 4 protein [SAR202 cluster bacterium]|jgi:phosphatidylinositol alpha-mannosyltransferase|nr:glycosyltransferase family 4 protein [SAR202 cluster bacterium]MDP6299797.1 glycosyltransferase family 4 protein [SAR202 cluster bacterium]MDP7102532.1 glycosyltransferase family 4 protein [SAR202 cluster bacterium]MDP7223862.1 glycosyltransferase family 4 protein [SAR202 cluster bacterium]MDP7412426.1 glycosyltransferase family 4 protein [SAR202 cluster bacterium]|tara:strand:+ start:4663 stop:5841 length:1179 start_codon:yes stop_codon:yes gene_type:complete
MPQSAYEGELMRGSLKIGFISPYDHAFDGGVTSHINKLAAQFRGWGHRVRIVAPCSSPSMVPDDDFLPMGRPVPIPSGGSVARVSLSPWLRPRIKDLLADEAFDIIHLHEPFAGFVPFNVMTVLDSMNGVNVGTFHTFQGTKLYGIGLRKLMEPFFRRLHGRIAVSGPAFDFINGHFPANYEIIPNGIRVEDFSDALPLPELMDGKINLLYLGRLEKRKGLKHLLGAYARLKWDWPELRLVVVGAGDPDADSHRMMSERNLSDVVFTGRVSDSEKARYFKSAHIYCSPATGKESFGIVLLEAMAAGAPVVATDIDGYAGVINHGEDGLLVPPKNDEQLARAIDMLLRDPGLRERLSENGVRRADEFRWERVAGRVIEYYEKCAAEESAVLSR